MRESPATSTSALKSLPRPIRNETHVYRMSYTMAGAPEDDDHPGWEEFGRMAWGVGNLILTNRPSLKRVEEPEAVVVFPTEPLFNPRPRLWTHTTVWTQTSEVETLRRCLKHTVAVDVLGL